MILKMAFYDVNSNPFFYAVLFLILSFIAISWYKKNRLLIIVSILFLIAFISVRLSFKQIEEYYFNKAISKGAAIKKDLKHYYDAHNKFPEGLNDLYKKSEAPQYNIGILKYNFSYYKTDTSYKLYFNHFEGRMFVNYGESNIWNFYD